MYKRITVILAVIMLLGISTSVSANNKALELGDNFVNEITEWDWVGSVSGDVLYLVNEGKLYGGAGFNILETPNGWFKLRAGYLPALKGWWYSGITLNGGKVISKVINITDVEIQSFVEKALLNVGVQFCVNPADGETDFGLLVTVIKWEF